MPFRHVVMFKWADHVDAEHVEQVRERLSGLPALIGEIRSYVHGSDVGVSAGNFDYALVADFDNVNDFRTYRDHPDHVLLIEELIKDHVAERAAVQYATSDQPGAGAASMATGEADGESDDALLERARRTAMAEMQALMAEPDEIV